jgi:UDP-glucose 4-epimerase
MGEEMIKVLVVGGAGYIGSHMVKRLGQLGCQVTTLDDLSSGHRDAVLTGEFVQARSPTQTCWIGCWVRASTQ